MRAFGVRRSACGVWSSIHRWVRVFINTILSRIFLIHHISTPHAERRTPNALLLVTFVLSTIVVSLNAATPLTITYCDTAARPGLPLRCRLERDTETNADDGPWILQVSLEQAENSLAHHDIPITTLAHMRFGIDIVMTPPQELGTMPLRLHAVLISASRRTIEQSERLLPTPTSLAADCDRAYTQASATRSGVPLRLWAEQAAELESLPPSLRNLDQLAAIIRSFQAWTQGIHPDVPAGETVELSCLDPIDNSVQPCRLRLPKGNVRTIAVILGHFTQAVIKSQWENDITTWYDGAGDAGVALLEVYPAGDRRWEGMGLQRAALALTTARTAVSALVKTPAMLLGVGPGAQGAVRLAERDPSLWTSVALIAPTFHVPRRSSLPSPSNDPVDYWLATQTPGFQTATLSLLPILCVEALPDKLAAWRSDLENAGGTFTEQLPPPDDKRFWRVVAATIRSPSHIPSASPHPLSSEIPQSCGPLSAYADKPFVIVVGTNEHAQSSADNKRLAELFVNAWMEHAHGRPPQITDREFRASQWPHHHLVLIGNPRSNSIMAELIRADELPIRWDGRSVFYQNLSALRSSKPTIACCWPHPAHDGRLLILLDGSPAWSDDGLPLSRLPDLVVGMSEQPLIRRLLDPQHAKP